MVRLHSITGQQTAKRACEIAASGAHSTLFIGPSGFGKSTLMMAVADLRPRFPHINSQETWAIIDEAEEGQVILGSRHGALMLATRSEGNPHITLRWSRLFDMVVQVPALAPAEILVPAPSEDHHSVKERVNKVWDNRATPRINGRLTLHDLREMGTLSRNARDLLLRGIDRMRLCARMTEAVWRVALTISEMDGAGRIDRPHIAEALSFAIWPNRTVVDEGASDEVEAWDIAAL